MTPGVIFTIYVLRKTTPGVISPRRHFSYWKNPRYHFSNGSPTIDAT